MPTAGDQLPGGPSDLSRRVRALERELNELRAGRRGGATSIGEGGLSIVDGGRLLMQTPDGQRMVDIGAMASKYNHLDGSPQQGILLRREDGTLLFACFADPDSVNGETQAWTFYDRSGTAIFAEDTNSGSGIARPWLALFPPNANDTATWPKTTATAFTSIATSYNRRWQPRMRVFVHTAVIGTATGEVRLSIEGTPWGAAVSAGNNLDVLDVIPGGLDLSAQFKLEVEARRLTGTGSIAAQVRMMYGIGS